MTKLAQCSACKNYKYPDTCEYYKYSDDSYCEKYEPPFNNSEGMFKHLFSFKGRIRRLEYGITYLLYMLYCLPMELLDENNEDTMSILFASVWLLFLIPALWIIFAQGVKRCHDRGNSGWFQFIPFYIFWLLFADGEEGVNKYGTSPKEDYKNQIYTI